MRQIVMDVPRAGIAAGKTSTRITTIGFQGETCKEATKALQQLLGQTLTDEETAEMHETAREEERRLDES